MHKIIIVYGILGLVGAQDFAPPPIPNARPAPLATEAREYNRDSVAKAIRDNIDRQKLVKSHETVVYYGNEGNTRTNFAPIPRIPRPQQVPNFKPAQPAVQSPSLPRIRIPVVVPKRVPAQVIAPPKIVREEPEEIEEIYEPEPVTTTTSTRRPQKISSRIQFDNEYLERPRPAKRPVHVPIIPKTPQIFSNDIDTKRRVLDDEEEEQAKSAHYQFSSNIEDTINDNSMSRSETRDGTSLTGMFSYSDGFFKRTVHYVADENGYRVIKEEIEPVGDGPQFNPDGKADVTTSLAGSYSITADDIRRPLKQDRRKPIVDVRSRS